VLALFAVVSVGHTLISSTRRRRSDLAVLKTIGFTRGQVSATVAWQATTLIGLAIVIGVPLGLAAGRWSWTSFANQLGVPPSPRIPAVVVGGVVLLCLVLANVVAAIPARAAARTQPAVVLRAE